MRRKILLALAIAVFIGGGLVYWQFFYQAPDNVERVNTPIAEPVGEVEPVLEIVASELGQLWGIDFIPDTSLLVATQKDGELYVIDTEDLSVQAIDQVPTVDSSGQGGLLDVVVSPDFAESSEIFLTYSATNEAGLSATHLMRAELDLESGALQNTEVLYIAEPFLSGGNHFGSRVIISDDHVYMTIGDRNDKNFSDHVAQDTSNALGSTIRLQTDGSIPPDNPFVGDPNVLDEIYSYGHRNAQGMAIQPGTGDIWQSEHGERDGDEINKITAGGNYGWPIATYGCRYGTSQPVGETPSNVDGTVPPEYFWECGSGGFPPAGMAFYDADGFTDWQGDLFVGGLASEYLAHFRVGEEGLVELDPLLEEEGWRVRDVAVSQIDGAIYTAVEGSSVSLVRITPKSVNN